MPFPKVKNSIAQITQWDDQLLDAIGHLSTTESICQFLDDIVSDDSVYQAIICINRVRMDLEVLELKIIRLDTLSREDVE